MKVVTEMALKHSPFIAEIGKMKFYFSSARKCNTFLSKYEVEMNEFNKRLYRQYNKNMQLDDLALIRFYQYVQRSEFYIEIDGVGTDCLDKIKIESKVKVVS